MTDLVETSQWETGIYQFEQDDPVVGGPDGLDNLPMRQLANRTLFLKNQQTAHQEAADPHTQYLRDEQKASEAQAIAGLDNESWMTALRVAQAINALAATIANASETVAGKVELATPAETITGADSTRATHAAGVKAAIDAAVAALLDSTPATLNTLNELAAALGDDANFATTMTNALSAKVNLADLNNSIATNGYQMFPNGLIIQWGYAAGTNGNNGTVTLPIAFPHVFRMLITQDDIGTSYSGKSKSSLTSFPWVGAGSTGLNWLAIGN